MKKEKEWFESWFDTPYYHILYGNRDENEAGEFINRLFDHLSLAPDSSVLDLACGKGRHAKHLSELGYKVVGIDLSQHSIEKAKEYETTNLKFYVGDMRERILDQKFNGVLNLFTSFGYFQDIQDNLKVLNSIFEYLEEDGIAVIDFMNSNKVVKNLVPFEEKKICEIDFKISRRVVEGIIVKEIEFKLDQKIKRFSERVQVLKLEDFEGMFSQTGFEIVQLFGDYNLAEFDVNESERLILQIRKVK